VSTLDFGTGLQVSGFSIPTILTRRAHTRVELRDGQTFAIAGLIDNSMSENVDKIPILGDIPILGALFRSQDIRHDRSELMVLVTPRLVQPSSAPIPVPTGEPETWDWDKSLREPLAPSTPRPSGDR
jgi:pilus assembly protein CpaC